MKVFSILADLKAVNAELAIIEEMKSSQSEARMMQDRDCRLRVLQTLEYTDKNLVLQLKGRALGEVGGPYCLAIVESLFRGVFTSLTAEELCAVLSIYVCQDNKEIALNLENFSLNLDAAIKQSVAIIEEVTKLEIDEEVNSELKEEKIKFALLEVAYKWAQGLSFIDICKITEMKEGNIVRGIIGLHECLRTLEGVAVLIGDYELKTKVKVARKLIQRDIVFSASLYVSK